MYCGLICRGCGVTCSDEPTERTPLEIECMYCGGAGKIGEQPCSHCTNGYVQVSQCPRRELGKAFTREMRLVNHAMQDKLLPESGGINDQPARFVHLWQAFRSDVSMIEREEAKNG